MGKNPRPPSGDHDRGTDDDGNKYSPRQRTRRKVEEDDDDMSAMKPESASSPSGHRRQLDQEEGRTLSALRADRNVKKVAGPGLLFLEQALRCDLDVEKPLPITRSRPHAATVPGAVSGGGDYSQMAIDKLEDSSIVSALPPAGFRNGPIEAHLAPDDAEIEARMTVRLEGQITKQVEQRLMNDVIVATEVKEADPSSHICGFQLRTFIAFVMIFGVIVTVGGVATGVLLSMSDNDSDQSKSVPFVLSPTTAPVMPIEDVFLDELRSWIAPTEQDLIPFYDPYSAQSQALEWLHNDPISMSQNRTTETVLQRYVLAVLFFSTGGSNWFWPYLSDDHACTWNVDGEEGNYTTGAVCTADDETVDRLELSKNNLRGRLPWEIVLMTNLASIDFDSNSISGSIPSRIIDLSHLEIFWARDNDLTGTLPSTFSPVTSSIDLRQNSMNGSIPVGWGEAMPKLEYLALELNSFTGTIPSDIGNITPLEVFTFFGNSLTGSVDEFLCHGFQWTDLMADCYEVDCPCCTVCCYDGEVECDDMT